MDADFLNELFAGFGPVTIRRLFGGLSLSADGVTFALVSRGAIYLRTDESSVPTFEAEGSKPFQYEMNGTLRIMGSYWQLPERLYDDPDEVTQWARKAYAAATRAALLKSNKARAPKKKTVKKAPAKKTAAKKKSR